MFIVCNVIVGCGSGEVSLRDEITGASFLTVEYDFVQRAENYYYYYSPLPHYYYYSPHS